MTENWVSGSYEAGADEPEGTGQAPAAQPLNAETGVGIGEGSPSTFEPEEDPAAGG